MTSAAIPGKTLIYCDDEDGFPNVWYEDIGDINEALLKAAKDIEQTIIEYGYLARIGPIEDECTPAPSITIYRQQDTDSPEEVAVVLTAPDVY